MRFLRGIKGLCLSVGVLFILLLVYGVYSAPLFEGGEGYEFFLGTSSSAACISSSSPAAEKFFLPAVRGESARFEGDRYEELKARFHAKLLFTEEAAGTVSYYLYSPDLGRCVGLEGHSVNLQIAVRKGQTAVGSPVIFGGF